MLTCVIGHVGRNVLDSLHPEVSSGATHIMQIICILWIGGIVLVGCAVNCSGERGEVRYAIRSS